MPTAEENIYGRLHTVQEYHPANASLFTDWNVQAGDVVTVASGQENYQVPIYNMKLRWTGKPKVDIEATGNPERAPLPEMKRKGYADNSSACSSLKGFGGGLGSLTEKVAQIDGILHAAGLQIDPVSGVLLYASQKGADYALGAEFRVQAEEISGIVSKTGINELGNTETLYSKISQTAESVDTLLTKTGIDELGETETLYSYSQRTAEKYESVVGRVNGHESRITQTEKDIGLKADYIDLKALRTTVNNLISGKLRADKLVATVAELGTSHGDIVKIYGQQVRTYQVNDVNGNPHWVFGYGT